MSDSCNPMDCSPPGSFVRGISQAGVLEWVAISVSKGSSRPRDRTCFSCFFTTEPLASLGSISYFLSSLSFALDSVSIPDPIHYCLNFFNFISWYQVRWVSSLFYLSSVLTIFGLHTLFCFLINGTLLLLLFYFFGLTVWQAGPWFSNQGSNPSPMQWKCRVPTTGLPRNCFLQILESACPIPCKILLGFWSELHWIWGSI